MENVRKQAIECAEVLRPRANNAGTADLLFSCIDMVVELALAIGCNNARPTGSPGYGILFEKKGEIHAGQFTFFVARPKYPAGVVALAISEKAVPEYVPQLHRLVREFCLNPGISVPINPQNPWPAIGFATVDAGIQVIQAVKSFLLNPTLEVQPLAEATAEERVLRSIKARRGQPDFRRRLLAAYGNRCVITGCSVVEALEAAHIVPHSMDGAYATTNGLLMRADIHTLFDLHLLSICPDSRVVLLNPRLRDAYGQFEGQAIRAPLDKGDKPDREGLASHRDIWQTLFAAQ